MTDGRVVLMTKEEVENLREGITPSESWREELVDRIKRLVECSPEYGGSLDVELGDDGLVTCWSKREDAR